MEGINSLGRGNFYYGSYAALEDQQQSGVPQNLQITNTVSGGTTAFVGNDFHNSNPSVHFHYLKPDPEILTNSDKQLSMEEFLTSLKKSYLAENTIELIIGEKKLPIENSYIRLAIIGQKERNRQKKALHLQKFEDGRPITYETPLETKESIELEKLFEYPDIAKKDKKRAVIYGSAGIGKSTLCYYIAYQWSQGKLWSQFKAVFWLKFSNLNEKKYPQHTDYTIYNVLNREW